MTVNIVKIAVYLIATLCAAAVVHYFILFFRQPQKFWELNHPSCTSFKKRHGSNYLNPDADPTLRRRLYIQYLYLGLVFIGLPPINYPLLLQQRRFLNSV